MFKNYKLLILLTFIILLIAVPSSFAHENDTILSVEEGNGDLIEISDDVDVVRGSNDYYFNASAKDDNGNGSIDNPYRDLKASRINSNSNIHLANGEYFLDTSKTIENVNIIGENAKSTIIKFAGVAFTVEKSLTLTNLTMYEATIENNKNLNATNVIFKNGCGKKIDGYSNILGGAITCPNSDYTPTVNINNCTFIDNYAEYGGAIYMLGGSLDITDSLFINNYAYNFGGAIACEYGTNIKISKSKFLNSHSVADAGGAIYTRQATLNLNNVNITNSSATFGGAIASLNTAFTSNYLKVQDCSAKWDGGAVYHMYGNFTSLYGNFENNSANNGGALFIDNSTSLFLRYNKFISNQAGLTAGGVYSICNTLKSGGSVRNMNTYTGNSAVFQNDAYEASSINLDIANGNYSMYRHNESEITVLPSAYSLRDYNLVTIPKDQQSSGNCWAFAAIAVLESSILKASGPSLDLSEENMKNVIEMYSDYGWKMDTNEGGYDKMHFGYLASWLGPVLENDDPFDDKSTLSPVLNSIMHVQNIKTLKRDNYLDNDEIKMAILKYGAVGTSMYFDNNFFRGKGYYCWYSTPSNHAVTIVGWDDNYPRSNFYGLPSEYGDGAWIVRNSWGPDWKDHGYFYVSYYDEKFAEPGSDNVAYAIILNDTIKYDRNYQYDIGGMTNYYYINSPSIWYKNVFTAIDDEYIAGVSTYFEKITNWTASVYVNGVVQAVNSGTSNPGYYTIDLGQFIPVKSGDKFVVEFKVSNGDATSLPISESCSLNKMVYMPEISYLSVDGTNWHDLFNLSGTFGTHVYYSQVACIKAFTILNEINTITNLNVIRNDDVVEIMATVIDQYGNLVKNGKVTFNFNGDDFAVNINNGIASFTNHLSHGYNTISATFNAVGYNSSSNSTIVVYDYYKTDSNISASANNIYVDETPVVNVALDDGATGRVSIMIGEEEYFADVVEGSATIYLPSLSAGSYVFDVLYSGDANYWDALTQVAFNVAKYGTNISASSRTIRVDQNAVVNVVLNGDATGNVYITVNGIDYIGVVENGNAVIELPVIPQAGSHTFDVIYSGDGRYLANATQVTFNVNKYYITIKATARTVHVGDDVTVNVAVSKDATGYVSIFVDGVEYSGIINKGNAVIIIPDLPAGEYSFEVVYSGDAKYKNKYNVVTFNVNRYKSTIKATASTVRVDQNAVVKVVLPNDATGKVSIVIDGIVYSGVVSKGAASIILPNMPADKYTLDVLYSGDGRYLANATQVTFNVNKYYITIKATARTVHVGDDVTVNVVVSKDATGYVSIFVDGVEYSGAINKGNAVIIIPDLPAGEYSFEVVYSGDAKYKNKYNVVTFNVNRYKSTIKATARTVRLGDDVTVNVVLPNDATGKVSIVIGGVKYTGIVSKGAASIILPNLPINQYALDVLYGGDEKYKSSTTVVTFNVNKLNPSMKASAATVKVGNDVVVNVKLSSDATGNVFIVIGGVKYTGIVSNGAAKIIIPDLPAGQYSLEVKYSGDDKYKTKTTTVSFNVNKNNVRMKATARTVKVGNNVTVNVALSDDATGIVYINVNGKVYIVEVEGGNAVIVIPNLPVKQYSLDVYYSGDGKYKNYTSVVTFNVNP
ncbi:Ig-like domain repeat protein [Methanobrevibacter sp. YE315]|uniref:Ig-like domain repeat protein n=1 Tax=Methanobrevibacter sp. YE315 TaxID=1609968 RepID=UPI0008320474|nr:Ig-like domain repeat protein [Methanobrevibacter sp. YE315]